MDGAPLGLEEMLACGRVAGVAIAPGAAGLAVTVQRPGPHGGSWRSQIWYCPADGGPARPLSGGVHDDRQPAYLADGRLVFTSDRPHPQAPAELDPTRQAWVLPAAGGEAQPLAHAPGGVLELKAAGSTIVCRVAWVPGAADQAQAQAERSLSKQSGVLRSALPLRFWDHWVGARAWRFWVFGPEGACRVLAPEREDDWLDPEWSLGPMGRWLATTVRRIDDDRIWSTGLSRWDLQAGTQVDCPAPRRASLSNPAVRGDGVVAAGLHQRLDAAYGRTVVAVWTPGREGLETRAAEWEANVSVVGWAPDQAAVLVTAMVEASQPLFRVPATGQVSLVSRRDGHHAQVVANLDGIAGVRSEILAPPKPFLSKGAAAPLLLADPPGTTLPALAAHLTVSSMHTQGDGGVPVQFFVVRPRDEPGPLPVVLWVHGGPLSAWTDAWHWRWNAALFALRGAVLVLPNPRGSLGFGQDFVEGIRGDRGGACFRDVMAVADAAAHLPGVDPDRVAAMGGSFGGFMMNWIGTQTRRFACLVSHAGIYDPRSFAGATDIPPWWDRHMGVDRYPRAEAFSRQSPAAQVAGWQTPTLLVHGEKDYRVPVGEALMAFEDLHRQGVEVSLLSFPDENHWIQRPSNIRQWHQVIFDFLDRHLGGSADARGG